MRDSNIYDLQERIYPIKNVLKTVLVTGFGLALIVLRIFQVWQRGNKYKFI